MNIKKVAADPLQLLFVVYLAIPLVYVKSNYELLSAIRYWLLVLLPIITLCYGPCRKRVFAIIAGWTLIQKIMSFAIVVLMTITTIVMLFSQKLLFFGFRPYYLGLLSWIIFLITALIFQGNVKRQIFQNYSLYIFGIAMLVSVVYNIDYIHDGIRLQGVVFQPTSLSIYANLAAIVAMQQLTSAKRRDQIIAWIVLFLSIVVVLLTQSRIGEYLIVLNLFVWALANLNQKRIKTFIVLVVASIFIFAAPYIFSNTRFDRLQPGEVGSGISYRSSLYRVGLKDVISNNLVVGNGPGTKPNSINSIGSTSGDLKKTLQEGYTFQSAHNLYIDFAYYFGFLAAVALAIFTLWASYKYLKVYRGKNKLAFFLIFLALFANCLINTPSLELTSFFFIALLGLAYSDNTRIPKGNSRKEKMIVFKPEY